MLEEKIDALIAALEQNTNALLNGPGAPKVQEEPAAGKPENAKQKKARLAKEKKAAATAKGDVTVDSVKALAKKISMATDEPMECITQIRVIVSGVAESCYENANVGIEKFDTTGLILLQEELTKFVYTPSEPEAAADDLDI